MEELIVKLKDWIDSNNLQAEFIDDRVFKIGEESFYLLPERRRSDTNFESVFTEKFDLNISIEDEDFARQIGVGNYCFMFGNNFYYTPENSIENPQLRPLRYIGAIDDMLGLDYAFLGMRGKYELCNGSGDYGEWIRKSKFMGIKSLGICEHNTLAGTLPFQMACKKAGMPFVLGETITVRDSKFKEYLMKCYTLNQKGWFNLLYINKIINVDNVEAQYIDEDELLKYGEGLVLVLDTEYPLRKSKVEKFKASFDKVFYQLDMTEFKGEDKEKQRLHAQKEYLEKYMGVIDPIVVQDAFYLDRDFSHVKPLLNKIGSVRFQYDSNDQWFKSLDEIFEGWAPLFDERDDRLYDLLATSVENTMWVAENATYEIETGTRHLPKFTSDDGEDNEELFLRLICEGMERLGLADKEEYWERIERESSVIKSGGVIDYFLILWDIVKWCKTQGILVGVGRGSAAGSLVSYCLGITGLDPIEYDLLFERFINEDRIKSSLPDIDLDFPGERREEVKKYMEDKYGIDYVCSVGTYGTFKTKSAIKDIGRFMGLDPKTANYVTSKMESSTGNFIDLFKDVDPQVKQFIVSRPEIVETSAILLNQPKNASIHACATLILPHQDQDGNERNIYNWIPVKKMGGILVSEWEGPYLEYAGFLKEDILGIKQLDKFSSVFGKVKENRDIELDMASVDLENKEVYDLFRKGMSADVFHFGTKGLTGYAQDVQPYSAEEMIAMISLYRPGPIESHAHTDYVKFKFGLKEPEFDYMLEDVTKNTYGIYIYQEQVQKAVQILGGISAVDSDDVRKAMGKKQMSLIQKYKSQFIEGAKNNGCDPIDAETIWNKLEAFAGYGFNRSHAAAYTYTGIVCQWLKVMFPIEFWTTAFEFANEKEVPKLVSEVSKLDNGVSIVPPDINKSATGLISDFDTGKIYWSINKIKFVGDVAVNCIIDEREKNGDYFSLEEFYERVDTSKVNKRVIEGLILSGSFDEIYNIGDNVKDREVILEEYYKLAKVKMASRIVFPKEKRYTWYWVAKQKEVSGLGYFDFQNIVIRSNLKSYISCYMDPVQMQAESNVGKKVVIGGMIVEKNIRKTRKGDEFCAMVIDSNYELVHVLLWPDSWAKYKHEIEETSMGMFIGSGTVQIDGHKKCNVVQSDRETKVHVF